VRGTYLNMLCCDIIGAVASPVLGRVAIMGHPGHANEHRLPRPEPPLAFDPHCGAGRLKIH
jgi:hypothetical protein